MNGQAFVSIGAVTMSECGTGVGFASLLGSAVGGSLAIGPSEAGGAGTVAVGIGTTANGVAAVAIGNGVEVAGANVVAIGNAIVDGGTESVVIGD